ncbi:FKBP-type peptidyl-prolyl cis-trans isomerase [Maribacter litoralis]|uniref:Peptidyl-prolyl cis-trans isomerase n=1 Tax=Maribacter litoralis TaxID=2059726 RepID=A0A653XF94_9FLAO|nr:FKBP-type peptidyl-prolyl cis-trans isomerase [Maribacter litoralis]VXC28723.1 Peptidyl-prolyl cis-trans isomerase [Maribacter litoralis]
MKYIAFLFLLTSLVSCKLSDDTNTTTVVEPIDYTETNEAEINAYLEDNSLESQKTASGLHYIIENQGEGAAPTATSNVTVAYKGYFLNGTVFDQSEEGITIGLDQVISGWTEGIQLFNEGGNGMLLIPAHLGYGSFDYNGIPGGSVLVFDIELLSVN